MSKCKNRFVFLLLSIVCLITVGCKQNPDYDALVSQIEDASKRPGFPEDVGKAEINSLIEDGEDELLLTILSDESLDYGTRMASIVYIYKAHAIKSDGKAINALDTLLMMSGKSPTNDNISLLLYLLGTCIQEIDDKALTQRLRQIAFADVGRDELIGLTASESWLNLRAPQMSEFIEYAKQAPRDRRMRAYVQYAKEHYNYKENDIENWQANFDQWLDVEALRLSEGKRREEGVGSSF